MNDFLNRAMGLSSLRFGDPDAHFAFARPLPAWGWALVVLAAVALALWSYSRLTGRSSARVVLAALRSLLLILLVVLIAGPQLVKPNERVEQDWVLVLADRSASMAVADAPEGEGVGGAERGRPTRDAQLREMLARHWPAFEKLAAGKTVVWLGFDGGVHDLKPRETDGKQTGVELGQPTGRRTRIGAALEQALARVAARPLSGVVILSDGRSADEPSHQVLRRLQAERVPVYTVALGSPEPIADLALERAEAPSLAFVNDTVPVSVQVERLGVGGGQEQPTGKVQLVEKVTGRILDEQPLPVEAGAWADGRTTVVLTTRPDLAGKTAWVVRVMPEIDDLIPDNNQAELAIELVDRPLRVAQFDGYPRWEYLFVKNLLLREQSILSASLLLASNRQYLQEGEIVLDAVPRTFEEWKQFDAVVIGDVSPAVFGREQLEQLKEHVATNGAGLLWIGGPGATPGAWRDSPLADLLPFTLGSATSLGEQTVRPWDEPVVMFRAPAAERLRLLDLGETHAEGWPRRLSDPATGWSQLHFAQRIDPSALKPTAEVLATVAPAASVTASSPEGVGATPAVVTMRYGAGRVMYVATDEIWRWRYARGEVLPERFWLPLLRLQGRESLARASRPAVIEVGPRRPVVEQAARIAVELLDQSLVDAAPSSLTVRLRRLDDAGGAAIQISLPQQPGRGGARVASRGYATTWSPTEPGRFRLEVADPLLASLGLGLDVDVVLPDDELRHPEADHALLSRLSRDTEGSVLPAARLSELPDLLPKREIHVAGTPDIQTLWDRPLALTLLLALLTFEWIGRRLIKLS